MKTRVVWTLRAALEREFPDVATTEATEPDPTPIETPEAPEPDPTSIEGGSPAGSPAGTGARAIRGRESRLAPRQRPPAWIPDHRDQGRLLGHNHR